MTIDARFEAYKRDGFTVFENLFSEEIMQAWKDAYPGIVDRQSPLGAEQPQTWLRSTLEFEPKLFLPAVANPQLLDFAERLMGPFVQMDNLTFMAFPSMTKEEAEGRASGWHRVSGPFTRHSGFDSGDIHWHGSLGHVVMTADRAARLPGIFSHYEPATGNTPLRYLAQLGVWKG